MTAAARADSRVQYPRQSPCILKKVVPVRRPLGSKPWCQLVTLRADNVPAEQDHTRRDRSGRFVCQPGAGSTIVVRNEPLQFRLDAIRRTRGRGRPEETGRPTKRPRNRFQIVLPKFGVPLKEPPNQLKRGLRVTWFDGEPPRITPGIRTTAILVSSVTQREWFAAAGRRIS